MVQKLPCRWVWPKKVSGVAASHQGLNGIAQRDHIFIFIYGRAVNELDGGQFPGLDGAMRQALKPFQIWGSELVAGPQRRQSGDGIEVSQVHRPTDCLVVVAAHEDVAQGAGALDDLVGAGAVSDYVPEVDYHVVRRGRRQTRFESFQVAMNIAY